MQEIPCFRGIKAMGTLFFPLSSPPPFPKKKGEIQASKVMDYYGSFHG